MTKPIEMPPLDGLKECYEYRDGALYHKKWNGGTGHKGTQAGQLNRYGYRYISYGNRKYREHRVIFYMMNGWVPEIIDHINGDKTDNHIENLQPSNKSHNTFKGKLRATNTSGHVGVARKNNKWHAQICHDYKCYHLGYFDRLDDALSARRDAEIRLFGFANDALTDDEIDEAID